MKNCKDCKYLDFDPRSNTSVIGTCGYYGMFFGTTVRSFNSCNRYESHHSFTTDDTPSNYEIGSNCNSLEQPK